MEHQLIQSLASENIFVNGTVHVWPHENISNNAQLFVSYRHLCIVLFNNALSMVLNL